ncbi:MAG TPA: hypothetical protein PLG84_02645 [Anaerolineaceae bacterium]|jgi:hypothetical protein|nr:hypothetical protein [Anaerolineaceae bacterium]HOE34172.1 hypothetical protein [Anaerolineaceae bacterium]HOT25169.1 hypothetical protein [Anaerolineaceae bacterium]HQH57724.1 hypothetical protein [Anaerolineaceae bacterium]HQK02770.1 hypothetical protein [Anaerolineaceae bacterium]
MEKGLLEIFTYTGDGYKPLIDFNCWRVALLRYCDDMDPAEMVHLERHMATDEVFVLLEGKAALFLTGGDGSGELQVEMMQPLKLYNVKQGAWHNAFLSPDATILLVENKDTSRENSEYSPLTPAQRALIAETARDVLSN